MNRRFWNGVIGGALAWFLLFALTMAFAKVQDGSGGGGSGITAGTPTQDGEFLEGNVDNTQHWAAQLTGLQIFLDTSTATPTVLGQMTFTTADDFLHVGVGPGPVTAVSLTTGGTGYTTATGLSTTGGTGSGAKVDISATSGAVTTISSVSTAGSGYAVGDVLTIVQSGASGATVTVSAINGTVSFVPKGVANTGLILGTSDYPTTAGAIWYDSNHIKFYNGSTTLQLYDANTSISLVSGTTAVTQTTGDTSTDVATDAFVANSIAAISFPASGITPVKKTASFYASKNYEYLFNATGTAYIYLPYAYDDVGPIGIRNVSSYQVDLIPQNALTTIETAMGTSNTAGHKIKCTGATCSGTLYSLLGAWYWQPVSGTWSDDGAVTGGTPAFVQATSYASDTWGPAATSVAFSSNVTAGNTILVFASAFTGTSNTAVSVSDSQGNAFQQVMFAAQGSTQGSGTAAQTTGLWAAYNAIGGADTVKITWGAGAASCYGSGTQAAEFSSVSRLDGTPSFNAVTTATQTPSSNSLTTSNASDLIIGIVGGNGEQSGNTTFSAGSGYTLLGSQQYTGFTGWEYKIVTTTGSQSASFSTSNAAAMTDTGIAAFANY
jgi:hypothetical protein